MSETDLAVLEDGNTLPIAVTEQFGKYSKHSNLCPVCTRRDHHEINMLRAQQHKTLDEIAVLKQISKKELSKHFENHFVLSKTNQDIINVLESTDTESREIITRAFEGNLDIIAGGDAILKSQAERLVMIRSRMKVLSDELERDMLEEEERKEFIELNKLCSSIESEMFKVYRAIDKKLFPPTMEGLYDAILSYKLDVAQKMLDQVWVELAEFETKGPDQAAIVTELKSALAIRFNRIEDEVMKSGGILKSK